MPDFLYNSQKAILPPLLASPWKHLTITHHLQYQKLLIFKWKDRNFNDRLLTGNSTNYNNLNTNFPHYLRFWILEGIKRLKITQFFFMNIAYLVLYSKKVPEISVHRSDQSVPETIQRPAWHHTEQHSYIFLEEQMLVLLSSHQVLINCHLEDDWIQKSLEIACLTYCMAEVPFKPLINCFFAFLFH
jgi:hypothetical protein